MAWRHNPRRSRCVQAAAPMGECSQPSAKALHAGARWRNVSVWPRKDHQWISWVWDHVHAKWEHVSPRYGLKVLAERGFWFLWVPYCCHRCPFSACGVLAESGEPSLWGDRVVLHYDARIARQCHSVFQEMECKCDLLSH